MITGFRRDKQYTEKRRRFFATIFIFAAIIFFVRGPLANSLGGMLAGLGRPIWSLEEMVQTKFTDMQTLLSSKSALLQENARLQRMLDAISIEAYSRDTLALENETLKAKLGRSPESTFMLARVLAAPSRSPYDTFVIDTGSDKGVALGMKVFGDGNFVAGEVTRVWQESAVVTLYSAPGTDLPVTILGSSSVSVTAHGTGGGNFQITLPKGTPIFVGDLVDIPALSPEYIGAVEGIKRDETSSLQTLFIKLPFNIYEQKWVYVALPVNDRKSANVK